MPCVFDLLNIHLIVEKSNSYSLFDAMLYQSLMGWGERLVRLKN